ncbi:hypothetical protein HG530_008633 [Fusarium avenaceum]|nr:hypothetical protein HG530_008633 [Fusarium avenaceum]
MSSHYPGSYSDGQQSRDRDDYGDESRWYPYVTTIAPADYTPPTRAVTPGNAGLRRVVVRSGSSREWELQDENADLKRRLQDSQQIVSCLQSERDDLKTEVTGLQAQLSYATGTLTTQLRKELDDIRPEAILNQRLKDQSTLKSNAINRLTTEAAEQFKTIQQLKREISNKNGTIGQLQRDGKKAIQDLNNVRSNVNSCKQHKLSRAEKRKQRREAEMANRSGNEGLLISKFVQDSHLTDDVLAQISRIAANVEEKKSLYALLYSANNGVYYCIHEAVEKGMSASKALFPGISDCPARGVDCNFMVKGIMDGVVNKFQIFNPNAPIPDTQQTEVQGEKSG